MQLQRDEKQGIEERHGVVHQRLHRHNRGRRAHIHADARHVVDLHRLAHRKRRQVAVEQPHHADVEGAPEGPVVVQVAAEQVQHVPFQHPAGHHARHHAEKPAGPQVQQGIPQVLQPVVLDQKVPHHGHGEGDGNQGKEIFPKPGFGFLLHVYPHRNVLKTGGRSGGSSPR